VSETPWQAKGINRLLFKRDERGWRWTKRAELYYIAASFFYRRKHD
jgi:hypothetical protein